MHSMFLPGEPLPAVETVQDGQLYHVQLLDGSVGTAQRRDEVWLWRRLMGGTSAHGKRAALKRWLAGQDR